EGGEQFFEEAIVVNHGVPWDGRTSDAGRLATHTVETGISQGSWLWEMTWNNAHCRRFGCSMQAPVTATMTPLGIPKPCTGCSAHKAKRL
ncbi:MAG: hypothetical protein RML75_16800, partial [Cyanobacteriota bacterium SKYGB_h_bin112]|nr:hypothetical protein [Cyanobacteriota bacterium SKYGB_h_bin112]